MWRSHITVSPISGFEKSKVSLPAAFAKGNRDVGMVGRGFGAADIARTNGDDCAISAIQHEVLGS